MFRWILLFFMLTVTLGDAHFFSFANLASYAGYFHVGNSTDYIGNELWSGIVRDCRKKMSMSCIQKNAYSYLDGALDARDNITVFDGFVLRKNNLQYNSCIKNCHEELEENLVDGSGHESRSQNQYEENFYEDEKSPLEEVTSALRDKTVKFLATRDYEIQLPELFFEGSKIKISPREVDEDGALVRIDFGQRGIEDQGRFFKKIKKFIQNRLMMSFLALILIIKLIKIKFMFILPFLFGIGTAKKIFLKILLFFIPAFAHIFKLCSSYYHDHVKYHHHHHHRVAHHHHHVPVPVPVPAAIPAPGYYDSHHHEPPHSPIFEEEFQGYDYAHPHIQLRKDMDELKEWGIDTIWSGNEDPGIKLNGLQSPAYSPVYSQASQYSGINIKTNPQIGSIPAPINIPSHAQNLAYSGYLDDKKLNRRISVQNSGASVAQAQLPAVQMNPQPAKQIPATSSQIKSQQSPVYSVFAQPANAQIQRISQQVTQKSNTQEVSQSTNQVVYEDGFYGPILQRLDGIFSQLKFVEENCKERLICSMYKNPTLYSPHSNLVSNELSRDPQELKRKVTGSASSQRFYRYMNAARLGQDGGNCQQSYPCQTNTE